VIDSTLPAGLLRGEPGIYRVAWPIDDLVRRLTSVHWRTGVFIGTGAGDRRTVLRGIGRALGFPSYYGANLDALWDCLTDLTEPTALVWRGWPILAAEHPEDWARVWAVLAERVEATPSFAVVLVP
jgi:RNAse (barnase) inhibitor barstar